MQKLITTLLVSFIFIYSFGQNEKKVSAYLSFQYNHTLYDVVKGNNPWGAGLGFQTYLNTSTKFKLLFDVTADAYLEDDKVDRTYNGIEIPDVRGMVNVFVGGSFNPVPNLYLSVAGGPSFIHGQTLLGIKPGIGVYFSKSQRVTGKISYINIFNRDKITHADFGSLSFSLGIRLF